MTKTVAIKNRKPTLDELLIWKLSPATCATEGNTYAHVNEYNKQQEIQDSKQ